MKKESLNIAGILTLIVKHQDNTETVYKFKNIITTVGLVSLAELLASNTLAAPYNQLALGDGVTAADPADTALENELIRAAATITHLSSPDDTKVQFQSVWLVGDATGIYKEAGIFDAATAGNMFNRSNFTDVTVSDTDALIARWEIDFQNV